MTYPELSIVVPTYNESGNVERLVERVTCALDDECWELVFVDDDSPDGTYLKIRALAEKNPRIRLVHRIGRSGLSSACLEGMLASTSRYIAVMDADLQHDESLLKAMFEHIRSSDTDIVVASRATRSGDFGDMPDNRVMISKFAAWLADRVLRIKLSDPMSGFFMMRRELLDDVVRRLYGKGFKILLDICVCASKDLRFHEIPYTMRARTSGQSKLGLQVIVEYLLFLLSKGLGRVIPVRFMKFCIVGSLGVLVHLVVLSIMHKTIGVGFLTSQIVATYTAMTGNYILNNRFTFVDRALAGLQWWKGLLSFMAVCSIGALVGISTGEFLHNNGTHWLLAGFATTLVAALWNFSVSLVFTWRKPA